MSRLRLVLWGASGHAAVVAEAARLSGEFEVVGCIDDVNPVARRVPAGEVLGGSALLPELLRDGVTCAAIAIGDNAVRARLGARAEALGFVLPTIVHPRAVCSPSASLGPGCVLAAGAIVNPTAVLARLCIVNTGATVDHDCTLAEAVHVCPGAHIAGHVTVGAEAQIGVGASVRDRITIGAGALVGVGAAVVADVPAHAVAYGVPAKVVRTRG